MSYRYLGCHPRKKFTFGTGYQTTLQLDKANSQQTTDIKAGFERGKGKPQARRNIQKTVEFS